MANEPESIDWLVPFPKARNEIPAAKNFRTTWLISSQAVIRERGRIQAYEAALDPQYRQQLMTTVPGVWVPIDVARAHYLACDRLGFTDEQVLDNGRLAMRRTNASSLAFITRAAKGAGVTPWVALAQSDRIWRQTWDGSAVAVRKIGPKEAQIDMVGCILTGIRYNRVAMRGIILAGIELFCGKAYAREVPSISAERFFSIRLSWA